MSTATSIPTVTKRIGAYDRLTKDFAAYVIFEDGTEEYIDSRPTQHDASLLASDYIIQFYSDSHTPEKAAELVMQELEQEGRHEQMARDMGAVWSDGACDIPSVLEVTDAEGLCPSCRAIVGQPGACADCRDDNPIDPAPPADFNTCLDALYQTHIGPRVDVVQVEPVEPNGAGMWMAQPCFERVSEAGEAGPVQAYLCVDTWAGRREYPVDLVKETEKRYKIRLNGNEILPGNRVKPKGSEIYVPRYAVKFAPAAHVNWTDDDTVTTECAMCYSLQSCYDDGEAFICVDRGACNQRQAENRSPITVDIAAKLYALREECRAALTAGLYVQANSAKDKAARIAELYVSAVDMPVVVGV